MSLWCAPDDEAAHAQSLMCASPAQALFALLTATVKIASSHGRSSKQAPAPLATPGTRTPRHLLGTVGLRFVAPAGSKCLLVRIVVVVARWAQPFTLLELHGGAVHVVACLPLGVVVVAADRALPVPLLPLLLVIDRHRSELHRYTQKIFRFES
jgi:hypothetical protein